MSNVYFNSVDEAKNLYKDNLIKAKLNNKEKLTTTKHQGMEYTYYGKVNNKLSLLVRICHLFQIICTSYLIPLTFGLVLASRSFRTMLSNKITKLNDLTQTIHVYVINKLKVANDDPAEPVKKLLEKPIQHVDENDTVIINAKETLKVAEEYFNKGDLVNIDKAYAVMLQTYTESDPLKAVILDLTLTKLVIAYSKLGVIQKVDHFSRGSVYNTIEQLFWHAFESKLPNANSLRDQRKEAVIKFFNDLFNKVYHQIEKNKLKNDTPENVLKAIKDIFNDPKVQHDFKVAYDVV